MLRVARSGSKTLELFVSADLVWLKIDGAYWSPKHWVSAWGDWVALFEEEFHRLQLTAR